MARARNIKPGFFKNEELGTLTREARLLFIGLWTLADRNGRLEDRPARITAEVFPYDRDIKIGDVDTWLQMLADSSEGFIVRYVVGKTKYLQITNFAKHQSPHVKEQASTIPAPDMPGASPVQTPDITQPRQCVAPPDSLNPDSLNPSCLKEDSPVPGAKTAPAPVLSFRGDDAFEILYSRHPKKAERGLAENCLAQSLAGGADFATIDRVHQLYCEIEWTGIDGKFAPKLAQWLIDQSWRYPPKARDPPADYQSKADLQRQQIVNRPNPRLFPGA